MVCLCIGLQSVFIGAGISIGGNMLISVAMNVQVCTGTTHTLSCTISVVCWRQRGTADVVF